MTGPGVPLPPAPLRRAIAEAVHAAVAEYTGTDGYGHCYLYALAGWSLARELTGGDYLLQAGSLRLRPGPGEEWLILEGRGADLAGAAYHGWFALEAPGGGLGGGDVSGGRATS